jgi:hypothetical protein
MSLTQIPRWQEAGEISEVAFLSQTAWQIRYGDENAGNTSAASIANNFTVFLSFVIDILNQFVPYSNAHLKRQRFCQTRAAGKTRKN